ncbi:hypothetical protein ATOBIA_N01890 [Atopobiaceae bacterium P1]|uniref:L-threonylcarbamoyladenylate synthase n=1 Tax=Leptogranulimonas caecicola TaxID=2894156 RepID=A0AAU9CIR8_9ACTN|nr:hypothetical protein ATOBIA_N01890 [Atopobiaceae bacterium P1]BDC90318.1 hypothetical protein ATTO_01900 [Leptogranulimonas caecicola]
MGAVVRVNQDNPQEDLVAQGIRVLLDQGCMVMPTDSVYGIGAALAPQNPGHERIFEIKKRERTQTLPLLLADPQGIVRFGQNVQDWVYPVIEQFWPGALTVVVKAASLVPKDYVAANGTIAVRVPDSELVRQLARGCGGALAVTSANTHGAPSPAAFDDLESAVEENVDLVFDGGACPLGIASTIIDATGTEPQLLREGGVSFQAICDAAQARIPS